MDCAPEGIHIRLYRDVIDIEKRKLEPAFFATATTFAAARVARRLVERQRRRALFQNELTGVASIRAMARPRFSATGQRVFVVDLSAVSTA